ncbi:NitT/TauT family transport system substrate-binding protein [Neomicrococcus aestuarii]|uniref:NitT/TauT family transport system substrate-binding protein n=1 Tax=Neomicrococcus aestuarii TaxID=556325 RepID=A0A7W8WZB8_9MICC|nr:ABC transporter substrate-binding protein [Neomicrococcus aestuarii]MBB5513186.1 NitT/TauT family transport system substrate-binding protein [Neomicrococcus aestuarii]
MKRLSTLAAGLAVAAIALTGCGAGSPSASSTSAASGSGSSAAGLEEVTVGLLPIAPSVAIDYGVKEGIFEKHGLKVTVQTANAGAAMLPAVSTGDIDFGIGNPLSVMTAADKGLDMRIVTGYSNSKATGDDINGVVTRKDSGIKTFADLAGKTTSVNALKTQGDLTITESAEKAGADASALKFSEMPFQDMEAQLSRGNVDAIWLPEPMLSRALADENNTLVGYPNQTAIPGLPTMVSFTSGAMATSQPETVKKFQEALTEVLETAEGDQAGAKALLPEFMSMDAKVASGLKMETWDATFPEEQITKLGELAAKFKFISKAPDVNALKAVQ